MDVTSVPAYLVCLLSDILHYQFSRTHHRSCSLTRPSSVASSTALGMRVHRYWDVHAVARDYELPSKRDDVIVRIFTVVPPALSALYDNIII